jgi:hypothetical protein
MDADPSKNTVVFEFKRWLSKDTAIAQAATRADDGIEQAWKLASTEKRIKASQVTRIFSEWEPTQADAAFIKQTFPKAEISFSFARPDSAEGWDSALAEARRAMMNAMGEQMLDGAQAN